MGINYSTSNYYDWKPELPDFRDEIYKYPKITVKATDSYDLRNQFKEYTNNFGSSAANSIASILDSYELLYTFDNSDPETDSSIRSCIKKFKIIEEDREEYITEFDNPEESDNKTARLRYTKLCNFKNQLRQSISDGFPIIFGFTVFESFNSEEVIKTGIIKNPEKNEKILGGLCAVIVGFDGQKDHWIVRHPFGNEYGDNGYIYIPYDILSKNNNLTSDFWRISYE
jgi:C1A family cysteine protease